MHIPKIDGPPKSVANLLCTTLAPSRLIHQQHNWNEIIFEGALTDRQKSRTTNTRWLIPNSLWPKFKSQSQINMKIIQAWFFVEIMVD